MPTEGSSCRGNDSIYYTVKPIPASPARSPARLTRITIGDSGRPSGLLLAAGLGVLVLLLVAGGQIIRRRRGA